MVACECKEPHDRRRVVMTGGPGAGKTAVLELIRQSFCVHVKGKRPVETALTGSAEAEVEK